MDKLWCLTIDGFSSTQLIGPATNEVHELYLYDDESVAKNEFAIITDVLPEIFLPDAVDDEGSLLSPDENPFAVIQTENLLEIHEPPDVDCGDSQDLRIQLREVSVLRKGHFYGNVEKFTEKFLQPRLKFCVG